MSSTWPTVAVVTPFEIVNKVGVLFKYPLIIVKHYLTEPNILGDKADTNAYMLNA